MKLLEDELQNLGFPSRILGIGLVLAISCGSAGSASPAPVESASCQPDSNVENSETRLKPVTVVEPTVSLPVATVETTRGTKSEPKVSLHQSLCASIVPSKEKPVSHSAADLSAVTQPKSELNLEEIQVGLTPSNNSLPAGETQLSQTEQNPQPQAAPKPVPEQLDLSPNIIENSPVLQRWLKKVPNVLEEIRHDPSFRTRLRVGYSQFPSTDQAGGFNVGVEDAFVSRTGLTVSGDYQRSFNGKREAYGADLRYYVLPLGGYINIAPQVGYRNLTTGNFSTDGVNVGARLMLALSRTGAADISFTQSFVSPGSNEEVGLSTLSVGYALTHNLRLSTDIQKQNSKEEKDSRVGINFEWMP